MDINNSIQNPIFRSCKLVKDENGFKVEKTPFKQIVGNLRYLRTTRPNVMFVVGLISRYMEILLSL